MELLHEEPEHLHSERPEAGTSTEKELQITETQPEAFYCSSLRAPKKNSVRRKTPAGRRHEKNIKDEDRNGARRRINPHWLGMKVFLKRYTLEKQLGEKNHGPVYAGVRKSNGEQVAVKYLLKETTEYFTLPGDPRSLPLEVVLLERVSRPRFSPYMLKLLEWFETPRGFLLIMEWPHKFITLHKFRECVQGRMSEDLSRVIVCRVGWAALHCRDSGVLHRDIQEKNILLNPETLELKLIDFGNAFLLEDRPYKAFGGPPVLLPTQWIFKEIWPERATIRDLGVLLCTLTCGETPSCYGFPLVVNGLSEACSSLINWCLQGDLEKRPTLEQFLRHDWFYDKAFF